MGFMIRPRIRVRLLIGCCEVIIHPILASIIAVEHIRQRVFVAVRLRNDVAKVEVAVGIVVAH